MVASAHLLHIRLHRVVFCFGCRSPDCNTPKSHFSVLGWLRLRTCYTYDCTGWFFVSVAGRQTATHLSHTLVCLGGCVCAPATHTIAQGGFCYVRTSVRPYVRTIGGMECAPIKGPLCLCVVEILDGSSNAICDARTLYGALCRNTSGARAAVQGAHKVARTRSLFCYF